MFASLLKEKRACCLVLHVGLFWHCATQDVVWVRLLLVDSNNKVVDNHLGVVAVVVALDRFGSIVTLEAIPTKEKFADVTACVDVKHKFTTWVIINELANV